MLAKFNKLNLFKISQEVGLAKPTSSPESATPHPISEVTKASLEEPATHFMNLLSLSPEKILKTESTESAYKIMQNKQIHYLQVSNEKGEFLGIITAKDILKRRVLDLMKQDVQKQKELTLVKNTMIPNSQRDAIFLESITHARLGDLLKTLHNYKKQIVFVVSAEGEKLVLHGLVETRLLRKFMYQLVR